uniref:Eukaryotic translation initiation factor 4E-1B-like n=1 Tax=Sinocyclocheilus rhinocerous TaxID=307959 RepID=A0A673MZ58_9TELE
FGKALNAKKKKKKRINDQFSCCFESVIIEFAIVKIVISFQNHHFKRRSEVINGPYMKHPLQNRWGLWFYKNDKSKMWQDNLRLITKFDTAEDFWDHVKLKTAVMMQKNSDGIEPMWEDRSNKCGGRWLITLAKQHRHTELDHFWLETLLCLIGEGFGSFSRDICGSVINIRAKGDKIAIWTSNAENCETVTYIGKKYKESLGLPQKLVIGYQAHADTATKSNSITKNKFVV